MRTRFLLGLILLYTLLGVNALVFAEEDGFYFGSPNITKYNYGVVNACMGGASTATANDPFAAFANPAGIASLKFVNIATGYHFMAKQNHLGYLGFTLPRLGEDKNVAIGIAVAYNTVRKNFNERDSSGTVLGSLQNHGIMGMGTFAIRLGGADDEGGTLIGGNIKYVHELFGAHQTINVGLDVGVILPKIIPFIDIGASVYDIMISHNSASGSTRMANPTLKISIATSNMDWGRVALQIDKNLLTEDLIKFHIGGYFKIVARAKYGADPGFEDLPEDIFKDVLSDEDEAPPDIEEFQSKKGLLSSKYQYGIWLMAGFSTNRFTAGISTILFGMLSLDIGVLFPNRYNRDFGFLSNLTISF